MKIIDRYNMEGMPSLKKNSMPCFVDLAQESDDDLMMIIEIKYQK